MKLKGLLVLWAAVMILGSTLIACTKGTSAGELAPDFTLQTLDGQPVSLSDFRGKPVLLNFWATWCGPCRGELPYLISAHQKYQDKGLILLAVDIGEGASKVRDFVDGNRIPLQVLLDSSKKTANLYNIRGVPTSFFIDSQGVLRDTVIGAFPNLEMLESKLSQIME